MNVENETKVTGDFYSAKRQFFREWAVLLRVYGLDTFLGGLYPLFGFYIMHRPGGSQVYNVVLPFIIATATMGYLAYSIQISRTRGGTSRYYSQFPGDQTTLWDAQIAYLIASAIWINGVIAVGAYFKLGGANYVPYYRLHPEMFCLPFLVIAFVIAFLHNRHSKEFAVVFIGAAAALAAVIYFSDMFFMGEKASRQNDFYPPRVHDLKFQLTIAFLLLTASITGLGMTRFFWKRRELGEIL